MKFATAMLAMADGKKVRRACWKKDSYWEKVGGESAIDSKGNLIDDWEMFSPVSTLSSKISVGGGLIKVTDVKEYLNKFLNWCEESIEGDSDDAVISTTRRLNEKAKEIFGEELVVK